MRIEEALSYLGCRRKERNPELIRKIMEAEERIKREMEPKRAIRRYFAEHTERGVRLEGTGILLTGKDAEGYFGAAEEIVTVFVSLGERVSEFLREEADKNIGRGLLCDAVASALVTELMEKEEESLVKEEGRRGFFLSRRFGAGYGDLPLSIQKDIVEEMNLESLGVKVEEDYFLKPEKSLISIFGILKQKEEERGEVCSICRFCEVCRKEKGGPACACIESFEEEDFLNLNPQIEPFWEREEENLFKNEEEYRSFLKEGRRKYQRGEVCLAEYLMELNKVKKYRKFLPEKGEILVSSLSSGGFSFGSRMIKEILSAYGYSVVEGGDKRAEVGILSLDYRSRKNEAKNCIGALKKRVKRLIIGGGLFTEKECLELGGDERLDSFAELIEKIGGEL